MAGRGPKRRTSEVEDLDDDERQLAETEARESGMRAYRHWKDQTHQPVSSPIAMRLACPFGTHDERRAAFFLGWQIEDGTAWTHEWASIARPELKRKRLRIVRAISPTILEVEMRDSLERLEVPRLWIRRVA